MRTSALAVVLLALLSGGCMSLTTHTSVLSDSSHLGTPYPGTRADLHILVCFGRDVKRDASGLLFAPVMIFPLVDLPLSFVVDTVLLPVDIVMTAEARPQRIGAGGCRLVGM